jgi:hypothetical protein
VTVLIFWYIKSPETDVTLTITKLTKNCRLSATQKQSLIIEGNSYNAWSLLYYSRLLFSMNMVSFLNASLIYEFKRNTSGWQNTNK